MENMIDIMFLKENSVFRVGGGLLSESSYSLIP